MPKQKVKKSTTATPQSGGGKVSRTPVKLKSSATPVWWLIIMGLLLVGGLTWMIVFYLVGGKGIIPAMDNLDAWNYAIAFGLMVTGLLMTVRWR